MSPFEFDRIEVWGPDLAVALAAIVPADTPDRIRALQPDLIQDAREMVEGQLGINRMTLSDAIEAWVGARMVATYHGSRLTPEEIARVRAEGLRPLVGSDRAARLARILSAHAEWPDKADGLAPALERYGPREGAGRRQGQVHLTLSRAALVEKFPHYLTHGSEFDQHVAARVLGRDGADLLGRHGDPVVFTVVLPGAEAIELANRWICERDTMPELVRHIADAWCWWLACPEWPGGRHQPDCGLMLSAALPPERISAADVVDFSAEGERSRQELAEVKRILEPKARKV